MSLVKKYININLTQQTLTLFDHHTIVNQWAVSTAKNGAGEIRNSYKTPRGRHIIRAKIGDGAAINTVFLGRRPTGEIFTPAALANNPHRDWILTRILWLSGCEVGKNRLGVVDTMSRYIYIHGTPDDTQLGKIGSKGCIRMNNHAIIALFNHTIAYTPVMIVE